jgi:hypothetical protein
MIPEAEFRPLWLGRGNVYTPPASQRGDGSLYVPRRVKDYIDISEFTSLDTLIRYLETIRDNLPPECGAELKIRGDEIFGKRLTITYFREMTADELELEGRYSGEAGGLEDDARLAELQSKLDQLPYVTKKAGNPG